MAKQILLVRTLLRRKVMANHQAIDDNHRVIGLQGSRCSSVYDEAVICPIDLWEVMMLGLLVGCKSIDKLTSPSFDLFVCLWVSVYETYPMLEMLEHVNEINVYYSERWITRLANRWRAQQSAITIVNCRIYWAAITWTQIAVSGIPGTTFAWGSTNQHTKCNITVIVYMAVENWDCNWFVCNWLLPQVYSR